MTMKCKSCRTFEAKGFRCSAMTHGECDCPKCQGFCKCLFDKPLWTTLETESVDAEGRVCSECHDTAPNDKLIVYYTLLGLKHRQHDGLFCSKVCHDVYHGLTSYRSLAQ